MNRKSLPHQIRKQIKKELHEQQRSTVVAKNIPSSTNRQDTTQSQGVDNTNQMILPYLMTILGNRVFAGYDVIKTTTCVGLQVYITAGSAYFDISKYVETLGGSYYTIIPDTEDNFIYIYLSPAGKFIQNTETPVSNTNSEYIPLAVIWVEKNSTEILFKYIIDIRPNGIASLSDIDIIRSHQVELYNVVPNSLIGNDSVILADASESGDVKVHIEPNISGLAYVQGHRIIIHEDTFTLTLPESGTEDYYIIAHCYIDSSEMVYKQVAVGTTIERYQLILGKITGLEYDAVDLSGADIDTDMQCYCTDIVSHAHRIEDLSSQIPGTDFVTVYDFKLGTLKVLVNGLKERQITVLTDNSFRLNPTLESGDTLEVEYVRKY